MGELQVVDYYRVLYMDSDNGCTSFQFKQIDVYPDERFEYPKDVAPRDLWQRGVFRDGVFIPPSAIMKIETITKDYDTTKEVKSGQADNLSANNPGNQGSRSDVV